MSTRRYDVIVVGAGMIGSAAAKHLLTLNPQLKVALVGPCSSQVTDERDIHGAHYDEGRITRILDPDPTWSLLAERSIHRYRDIEQKSGIKFYQEVGFLAIGRVNGNYATETKNVAKHHMTSISVLDEGQLQRDFPYLKVANDDEGIYTKYDSGHINPRALVSAQRHIAAILGCDVIDDVVSDIRDSDSGLWLTTDGGKQLTANRVLLATGAFTQCRNLLSVNMQPKLQNLCTTVILTEIEEENLWKYGGMPCMVISGDSSMIAQEGEKGYGCYILSPVKYPNGKWYLKIGHGHHLAKEVQTRNDINDWYQCRTTQPEVKQFLMDIRRQIFTDLDGKYHFDQCLVSMTPTQQLYMDMVTPTLGVALGGCGWAAKSSDEIGYAAARMIARGSWDYDMPKEKFKFQKQNVVTSKL